MPQITYKNEEELKAKLTRIKSDGADMLHIVSDFDMTLTMPNSQGVRPISTWEVFHMSKEYIVEQEAYTAIYQPIEFDPAVPIEEKIIKMEEWWKLHLGLLIKYGLTKEYIDDGISHTRLTERNNLDKLSEITNQKQIPFLIFSAGLGDVIREFLKSKNILNPNIHIISNFFIFNQDGIATGFQDSIVHSFNKSEVQIIGKPYMQEIAQRKNVILLGDTLGDAKMIQGLAHDNIIKIGFLNGKTDVAEKYKEVFDVVIDDDNLDFVIDLVKGI